MEIKQIPSPNFGLGRKGRNPIAIMDHITGGAYPGCVTWLCNPKAKASAHYVVARSGEIVQLVDEVNRAWHGGEVRNPNWVLYDGTNPNNYTIGIEHEGYDGTLTEPQYQATLWLHRQIISRYGIPIDTDHIIGHYRVDSVNRPYCPGPNFPWTRLFADLQGGITVKDDQRLNAPIEDWEVAAIQTCVQEGFLTQFHDPRELPTYSELAAIMLNFQAKLLGK